MTEEQLKLLSISELQDLLSSVWCEFQRRGWTEEDMIDEVRSGYPEDTDDAD